TPDGRARPTHPPPDAHLGGPDGPPRCSSSLSGQAVRLAQAQLARAGRPGAPALHVEQVLGHADLLGSRSVGGVARPTGGVPAALRELQAAVVAVAGVDRPVAARLALGEA